MFALSLSLSIYTYIYIYIHLYFSPTIFYLVSIIVFHIKHCTFCRVIYIYICMYARLPLFEKNKTTLTKFVVVILPSYMLLSIVRLFTYVCVMWKIFASIRKNFCIKIDSFKTKQLLIRIAAADDVSYFSSLRLVFFPSITLFCFLSFFFLFSFCTNIFFAKRRKKKKRRKDHLAIEQTRETTKKKNTLACHCC